MVAVVSGIGLLREEGGSCKLVDLEMLGNNVRALLVMNGGGVELSFAPHSSAG
jgi:hypothetical protein